MDSSRITHHDLSVALLPLPPLTQLAARWLELETRARGSFFTSWQWIGAWLATYAEGAVAAEHLALLECRGPTGVLGLAIVSRAQERVFLGGARTTLRLHQTERTDDASAFIEYNGFLTERTAEPAVIAAMLRCVRNSKSFAEGHWRWDGFQIPGATAGLCDALQDADIPYVVNREAQCPWVDLQALPPDYLDALSTNTRSQIRRAMRLYESLGPLRLEVAGTDSLSDLFLAELRGLHEATWQSRRETAGAFAYPLFAPFIRAVLAGGGTGRADLLRVVAGTETVGYLLNFIHDGQVYSYQSGLAYRADNRFKPGLVAHTLAIAHYRAQGCGGYHFMAGDNRYKTSLSTAMETLTWLTLSRSRVGAALSHLKHRLVQAAAHRPLLRSPQRMRP